MTVDVVVETEIRRNSSDVAAYAGDPGNAPAWYVNIKTAVWKTPPPLVVGSQIDFTAHFLGQKLAYTYEVIELVAGEKLVMQTAQGPFPMQTTYTFAATSSTSTRMTLRNHGAPAGFSKIFAPLMATAMKRAMTKDLERLKQLLERA
jgi:hypothetical protein